MFNLLTDSPGVRPYVSHIGMCHPKGYGLAQFWSKNGYRFCPFWSGTRYGLQENYGGV